MATRKLVMSDDHRRKILRDALKRNVKPVSDAEVYAAIDRIKQGNTLTPVAATARTALPSLKLRAAATKAAARAAAVMEEKATANQVIKAINNLDLRSVVE